MKLKVEKETLEFLVGNIWHVADKRSTMRILSCILIDCSKKDSTLKMAATNIKNTIQQKVKINVDFDDGFAIQARPFNDVVKMLPEKEVEIEKYNDDRIKVTSGKFNARMPIFPHSEFPALPEIKKSEGTKKGEEKKQYLLSSEQLERLIERTTFSMSDDETRPYINGALLEIEKDSIGMITTDGHRMTIYREKTEDGNKFSKSKILVPSSGIMELRHFLGNARDKVQVTYEQGLIHFSKKINSPVNQEVEITLSVRLTDSEFPPYESVIPRTNNKVCIANRQTLLDAVKRVSVLASERNRNITIQMDKNKAVLKAEYAEIGDTEEVLDVGFEAEPLTIGFNSTYIIQVLNAIPDDQVEIKFGGELDGAIFKSIKNEDFLGIVMPVRL